VSPERATALVTGAAGMLGSQLLRVVPRGWQALGTDLAAGDGVRAPGVDLADPAAVEQLFAEHGPFQGVVHCAAYTAVDRAESEPERARRANVEASRVLAAACAVARIPLVLVSTDFVFDGDQREPYEEDAPTRPLSVYGRTKLEGELRALEAHSQGTAVVRTQWLYGPRGKHFPRTIVQRARELGKLRVVHDQVGSPTSTLELAPALWDVLLANGRGRYHAVCGGTCSWFEFTLEILSQCGLGAVPVEPCRSDEFPRPARRPAYSALGGVRLERLRGRPLAPWRSALREYLGQEPL
jgi:dTDP-4-dehydrorhamnose reductase